MSELNTPNVDGVTEALYDNTPQLADARGFVNQALDRALIPALPLKFIKAAVVVAAIAGAKANDARVQEAKDLGKKIGEEFFSLEKAYTEYRRTSLPANVLLPAEILYTKFDENADVIEVWMKCQDPEICNCEKAPIFRLNVADVLPLVNTLTTAVQNAAVAPTDNFGA